MTDKDKSVDTNTTIEKKSAVKKASAKKPAAKSTPEHVTVDDMHELLLILHKGLESRDKSVDYLQHQIALNLEQIEQNKRILAKRGLIYKLAFILLAIGVLAVGFDQRSVIKVFEEDMTNVSDNMDVMVRDMAAMRQAMESMSADMHSMSNDFNSVAKGVTSIDNSVVSITQDVKSISYGVRGMSYDTHQMNRNMDDMVPPFSPW